MFSEGLNMMRKQFHGRSYCLSNPRVAYIPFLTNIYASAQLEIYGYFEGTAHMIKVKYLHTEY